MTTTTSIKNNFFRGNLRKNCLFTLNIGTIVFLIGFLFYIFCQKEKNFTVNTIRVDGGWGYVVTNNNRLVIKQTRIPVISGKKSFQTQREAMAVGELVTERLTANLSPTITENDLILLKIKR